MTVRSTQSVVVYVDGRGRDIDATLIGADMARQRGAALHLACVTNRGETLGAMRLKADAPVDLEHAVGRYGDADAVLGEVLDALALHDITVVTHVLRGAAPVQVRRLAKRESAAVVVLPGAWIPLELRVAASWEVVVAPSRRRSRRLARARRAPAPI